MTSDAGARFLSVFKDLNVFWNISTKAFMWELGVNDDIRTGS